MESFVGAVAIADLVKTTLGPKGMDKILQSMGANEKVTITNDGATILKFINIDNPAAKILVDISKTQDEAVGDGTTTVAVLAGELLREADKLSMKKIHPQIIIEGFRKAKEIALKVLNDISVDHTSNPEQFRLDLINLAKTTLSSKLVHHEKEMFAKMTVDAVLRLKGSTNLEYIKIIKKSGNSLVDSYLDEGFILEKKISIASVKTKENCKILLANCPMDFDKIKIYGSTVKTDSLDKVAEIEAAEKNKMKDKVDKILNHKCDVFINRQLIYDYPDQLLADKGVMVIEHADFDGTERLAAVLGADIVSTFDCLDKVKMGQCKKIEEIMIGEEKLIKFSGCARGEACTIVLRGSGNHVLDEAERSVHDALCVLSQIVSTHRVIYGGGNSEMQMAIAIEEEAKKVSSKEAFAMQSFASALKQIPSIISDNAGLDSAELTQRLQSELMKGNKEAGIDVYKATIGNMKDMGVTESLKVKEHAVRSAMEAAEMILRVDQTIECAKRKREDPRDRMG